MQDFFLLSRGVMTLWYGYGDYMHCAVCARIQTTRYLMILKNTVRFANWNQNYENWSLEKTSVNIYTRQNHEISCDFGPHISETMWHGTAPPSRQNPFFLVSRPKLHNGVYQNVCSFNNNKHKYMTNCMTWCITWNPWLCIPDCMYASTMTQAYFLQPLWPEFSFLYIFWAG